MVSATLSNNISLILPVPDAADDPPGISALDQLKTDALALVGVYWNWVLLQIPVGVKLLVNVGFEFTATTTGLIVEQPPRAGSVPLM